jgi:hypothetical protein
MIASMMRVACLAVALAIFCTSAEAVVIGKAVTPLISQEMNVSSFAIGVPASHNLGTAPIATSGRWVNFSTTGNFEDVFGYAARAGGFEPVENTVEPNPTVDFFDDTLNGFPADEVGVITGGDGTEGSTDFDNFFGVSDTTNNDNGNSATAEYTATWAFDITGSTTGLSVSIDMAAMGDFEAPPADKYDFSYSYDGVNFTPLFTTGLIDTAFTPLVSGSFVGQIDQSVVVAVNDPITMNGTPLDNTFQTLSADLATATSGTLTLKLAAITNGGSEVFAFRNITVNAEEGTPGLIGDYNNDNVVDAADYTVWRDGGSPDDTIAGYNAWAGNYGATATSVSIPEPTAALLAMIALAGLVSRRA